MHGLRTIFRVQFAKTVVRQQIVLVGVLLDHAMHVELGAQHRDRGLHAGDPPAGQAIGAAFVKGGDNLTFQ